MLSKPASRIWLKASWARSAEWMRSRKVSSAGVERLDSHGDSVDAGVAVGGEAIGGDALGVCLERDFCVWLEAELGADSVEQALDGVSGQQTWRSTSDKDG